MPHRDPETGKFVGGESHDDFDEIEQIHADQTFTIPAADLSGATGQGLGASVSFDGVELYDVDEILDRRDIGVLVWAHHQINVYIPSTETADGFVRGSMEVSTSPERQVAGGIGTDNEPADQTGTLASGVDMASQDFSDTIDVLGPQLVATGGGQFSDGASGVGGASDGNQDEWEGPVIADPTLDARDSIFASGNFAVANVDDASVSMDVQVWHVFGLLAD